MVQQVVPSFFNVKTWRSRLGGRKFAFAERAGCSLVGDFFVTGGTPFYAGEQVKDGDEYHQSSGNYRNGCARQRTVVIPQSCNHRNQSYQECNNSEKHVVNPGAVGDGNKKNLNDTRIRAQISRVVKFYIRTKASANEILPQIKRPEIYCNGFINKTGKVPTASIAKIPQPMWSIFLF